MYYVQVEPDRFVTHLYQYMEDAKPAVPWLHLVIFFRKAKIESWFFLFRKNPFIINSGCPWIGMHMMVEMSPPPNTCARVIFLSKVLLSYKRNRTWHLTTSLGSSQTGLRFPDCPLSWFAELVHVDTLILVCIHCLHVCLLFKPHCEPPGHRFGVKSHCLVKLMKPCYCFMVSTDSSWNPKLWDGLTLKVNSLTFSWNSRTPCHNTNLFWSVSKATWQGLIFQRSQVTDEF